MSKFGNKKTVVDDLTFDSKKEAARWQSLRLLERAGEICKLERQVKYEIIPSVSLDGRKRPATHYIADFRYEDKYGVEYVEDSKGFKTPDYQLKRKLMKHVHGIEVIET